MEKEKSVWHTITCRRKFMWIFRIRLHTWNTFFDTWAVQKLYGRKLKGMQNINKLKLNQVNMYPSDGSLFTLWMLWKVFQTVKWAFNIQQLRWECRRHAIKFKGKRRIQQAYLWLSFMNPDAITTYQAQSASWRPSSLCDLMRKENSTWKFQPFSCSHLH